MNEEQKLPLNESSPEPETAAEPEFDEDCQFLEDIQKRKADGPAPATEETVLAPAASEPSEPEDFVDMETADHDTSPTKKPQSRLSQLAERQMKRDEKEAQREERRQAAQDRRDEKQAEYDE